MLEQIFQGLAEWAYGQVLECWQYFSDALLDILNMDFSYLKTHIPFVDTIAQIMLAVGWALLLGNLVFQALKSMVSGLGFDGEDRSCFLREPLCSLFCCWRVLRYADRAEHHANGHRRLQVPDAVSVTFMDENAFGAISASWALIIIFWDHRHVQGLQNASGDRRAVRHTGASDHLRATGLWRRREPEHLRYFFGLVPHVRVDVLHDGQQRYLFQNAPVGTVCHSVRPRRPPVDGTCTDDTKGGQKSRRHYYTHRPEPGHHGRFPGKPSAGHADLYDHSRGY
jgi:hypothetical protein